MLNPPIPVKHPEWLEAGLPAKVDALVLMLKGGWPDCLQGWSLVVTCRFLLRCVYGSNRDAAEALMQMAEEEEAEASNA